MRPVLKVNTRRQALGLVAVLIVAISASARDFVKPVAQPAKTYRAHDEHPKEKVAIAADPYDTPEKAKTFSIDFSAHGYLPVFLVVTNDGDQPISIANMDVKLITRNRSKLSPAAPEDIFRHLANPQANTDSRIPFPIPHKKVKGTLSRKEMDEIDSSQFAAKAVEPHSTQSGFLYFDIEGISAPLPGAHMDVTRIMDASGQELMYFEIEMDRYLSAPQKSN